MRKSFALLRYIGIAVCFFAIFCHCKCMEMGAYKIIADIVAKRVVNTVQFVDHHTSLIRILLDGLGFASDTMSNIITILDYCEIIVGILLIFVLVGSAAYYAFRLLFKHH